MYEKFPAEQFTVLKPRSYFDRLAAHISEQVEDRSSGSPLLEKLARTPVEVQTLYWLWRFSCEAGRSGLEYLMLENLGAFALQIHAALTRIGANELVRRLEAAIPLALESEGAELHQMVRDLSWFRRFPKQREYRELHEIDKGIYPYINTELRAQIENFIVESKDVLIY